MGSRRSSREALSPDNPHSSPGVPPTMSQDFANQVALSEARIRAIEVGTHVLRGSTKAAYDAKSREFIVKTDFRLYSNTTCVCQCLMDSYIHTCKRTGA
jgi:hypothetical protein